MDLDRTSDGGDLRRELGNQYVTFSNAKDRIAMGSVAVSLRGTLDAVASRYPHLVSKSADLQGRIDEVLRQTMS